MTEPRTTANEVYGPPALHLLRPCSLGARAVGCICNPRSCPDPRDGKYWVNVDCPIHGDAGPSFPRKAAT